MNRQDRTDAARRRFLVAATGVVGGVGVGFAAVPFVASLAPSARARAFGAPVQVDFAKLEPGQQMTVEWRGKPVWILHRTPQMLQTLAKIEDRLRDPQSLRPQQPLYCRNRHRSIKPEFLIAIGICTHLGCVPTYRPDVAPEDLGPDWPGGYFCPCHGSRYDLAGRVYKGVPAPLNLEIPPHRYLGERVVEIGVDGKAA
ncbi:ubiquinol-cytochrome c reductase iron-sulfur subunit [Inmirania thermothiophila]|uniref:Ubiquinol-cytochrome c reductase iron-sulfur subunit n=1 Tax=Inmirania thermothiophila TaxID=1750597 RepID=A0A3N1Y7P8_9GAMM|nr:ubiquinol-cytochrome c reductase iron-sulfur subunit [Inmirania thermothiophila]ROR34780.1 ubiquinol-cytochrome c reductase iron-sulfur subunit [Inmirania thermothiophila]